jgi:glycosyltransferase involved in cell wall biosynthesis
MGAPLLSVCLITYNHSNYIRQAIDSVLMQHVNFEWELIIADDASTDGTQEILLEYKKKFPQFIRLVLQPTNVGPAQNWLDLITTPKAKYIAYFEGDDYWTDSLKLQKQVDYLEQNHHVSICLHNCNIEENGIMIGNPWGDLFQKYSVENVIKRRILGPSASYLFRNEIQFPPWFSKVYGGDSALLFLLAQIGEIHYLPDVMSVYRKHKTSAESFYRGNPLNKALRDINDCEIYLSVVAESYKSIVLKRIVWNYFYRIIKGLKMIRLKSILSDVYYLINYSIRFLWVNINNERS